MVGVTPKETFRAAPGGVALLETLYRIKFSKHTPLVVVLLSMIYTIYRTRHYLAHAFQLDPLVAWPTAFFLELLVLAAAASVFIALRGAYLAELKDEDVRRAQLGVALAVIALLVAFVALLGVAWADAWALTGDPVASLIMSLIQIAQMIFVFCFIIVADLEERERLRELYADFARARRQQAANECPYCHQPVSPNNRARHMAACPMKPKE